MYLGEGLIEIDIEMIWTPIIINYKLREIQREIFTHKQKHSDNLSLGLFWSEQKQKIEIFFLIVLLIWLPNS